MEQARATEGLIDQCFALLQATGYPKNQRHGVHIGFASMEKIKHDAHGNSHHYFK